MKNMALFFKCIFLLIIVVIAIAEISFLTFDPNLAAHIFNHSYYDAMDAAVQLGRLDTVSTLLGIIAVLLAIFSLIGFGYIRAKAEFEAKHTAKSVTEKEAPLIVTEWLNEHGVPYLEKRLKILESLKDIPKDKADQIAIGLDSDEKTGGEK